MAEPLPLIRFTVLVDGAVFCSIETRARPRESRFETIARGCYGLARSLRKSAGPTPGEMKQRAIQAARRRKRRAKPA